jgi:hypothetical protein
MGQKREGVEKISQFGLGPQHDPGINEAHDQRRQRNTGGQQQAIFQRPEKKIPGRLDEIRHAQLRERFDGRRLHEGLKRDPEQKTDRDEHLNGEIKNHE